MPTHRSEAFSFRKEVLQSAEIIDARRGWQGRKNGRSVTHSDGSSVEQRQEAFIAAGADQPSESLLQPHGRNRNHIAFETALAAPLDCGDARRDERIARRRK